MKKVGEPPIMSSVFCFNPHMIRITCFIIFCGFFLRWGGTIISPVVRMFYKGKLVNESFMMQTDTKKLKRKLQQQSEFNRHEAKYIIHPSLVPKIRKFIAPFCVDDPNGEGNPPEYTVTTLQLDSAALDLHYAKENEAINRFKMRIRSYDKPGCPRFLEIKRKLRGTIAKSRVMIPYDQYGDDLFSGQKKIPFRSKDDEMTFHNFLRLRDEMDLRPVVFIRYRRESYMGANEVYSRLTFDRRMCYRRTRSYCFPKPGDMFRSMDSATALNRAYSGVILEMKTFRDVPEWMSELTERFSLSRIGFCKYSTAMKMESLFYGSAYSDVSELCHD